MLDLHEAIDRLAMTSSVPWYGHVLRREYGDVLKSAFDFVVEDQRNNGRLKITWDKFHRYYSLCHTDVVWSI